MEPTKRDRQNLIMFPLGTVGRDMVYTLVTNFLLTFVLFTKNLTTSQFAAITAIMFGARIFDALNDPIMGNIIERTRGKHGKLFHLQHQAPGVALRVVLRPHVLPLQHHLHHGRHLLLGHDPLLEL